MTDHSKSSILLIQFAKWPVPGQVKTRIAKAVGDEKALAIHCELTRTVLSNLRAFSDADLQLWFGRIPASNSAEYAYGEKLWEMCKGLDVAIHEQYGADLGERMYHALASGLQNYSKVIIVGSDCPTVDSAYLNLAIEALDHSDIVLGPSDDGGYVLIGCGRILPSVFDQTEWGTERVLETTRTRAEQAGLTVSCLPLTWDVDEVGDWERWQNI